MKSSDTPLHVLLFRGALLMGIAVFLTFPFSIWLVGKFSSEAPRYQLQPTANGLAVARLDNVTGEIVFVRIDGNEFARYPKSDKIKGVPPLPDGWKVLPDSEKPSAAAFLDDKPSPVQKP